MKIDNSFSKNLSPKKEALIIAIIYLILESALIVLYDRWIYVLVTTIIIYFLIYSKVNKLKSINKKVEELSATKKGLESTKQELYMTKMLSQNIINNSSLVIFTWDLDYKILSFNPYSERVTGYKEEEVIGKSWVELFLYDDEKPKAVNLLNYLKSGRSLKNSIGDRWKTKYGKDLELIWTDFPIIDENNKVVRIISIGTDITDQKNLIKRLNTIAYYDSLTGLPNRLLLKKEAEKMLRQAKANNSKLAFLYIDIDNFKQINDTLGHSAGDKLLVYLSEILKEDNENIHYLSKLGEDEYSIILSDVNNQEDIINKTEKILEKIRQPWCIDNHEFLISASIGISVFPNDGEDFNDLMKYGNMAMYHVKQKGKNDYFFYQKELGKRISFNTFIINQIKKAIEEEQFQLHYQPIVCLKTGDIKALESLIRWNHPQRGYISPMEYIPLIEETGQILEVTSYILRKVIRQKKIWKDKGFEGFKVGVNISNKSLSKCGLDKEIEGLLEEYNVDPKELILEITETAFMDNANYCVDSLIGVEKLGIKIALDDFGTGYSSLAQLKNLPIHYVKMDKEFIKYMTKNSEEEIVVKTIIDLAHNLGLYVIAEGVETQEQRDILFGIGCDFGQGYYFSKPLDPIELESILKSKGENNE